jgi:hypothetical protein
MLIETPDDIFLPNKYWVSQLCFLWYATYCILDFFFFIIKHHFELTPMNWTSFCHPSNLQLYFNNRNLGFTRLSITNKINWLTHFGQSGHHQELHDTEPGVCVYNRNLGCTRLSIANKNNWLTYCSQSGYPQELYRVNFFNLWYLT